jgi:hypothetical protein
MSGTPRTSSMYVASEYMPARSLPDAQYLRVVLGGFWIHGAHGSLAGLFAIIALSQLAFGAINAFAMAKGLTFNPFLPPLRACPPPLCRREPG